jgi:hypothetical protein
MATEFDPALVIKQVTESVAKRFPHVEESKVSGLVRAEVEALAANPVHDYVAVLAERQVKKQLRAETTS